MRRHKLLYCFTNRFRSKFRKDELKGATPTRGGERPGATLLGRGPRKRNREQIISALLVARRTTNSCRSRSRTARFAVRPH